MDREYDKVEDYTKPSRQNKGGKRRQYRNVEEKTPKEIYKRQRMSRTDVESFLDEDDFGEDF